MILSRILVSVERDNKLKVTYYNNTAVRVIKSHREMS